MAKMLTMVYPETVAQFAGLLGGVESRFGVEENAQIRIGAPRDLDLSGVDPSVNVSEATAKTYDLFHLTDNVVIRIYAWYHDWQPTQQDPVINNVLQLRSYMVNTVNGNKTLSNGAHESGTEHIVQGFLSGSQQGMSGAGRNFCCPKTLVDMYKLKLVLVTEYYTEGLNPDGFGIILLMPTSNSVFPATLQTWSHISRGYMGKSNNKFYWDAVPGGNVYYPFNGAAAEILWVDNLQYFETFVKGYDPTFKVEDILDVGEVGDPIQDLDPSEPGGGEGDWDESSDPVDFPALPTDGALSCGACKAYKMTTTELKDLFHTLWDINVFDLATFQKLLDNPLDAIVTLNVLPLSLSGYTVSVWLGNFNTNVNGERITSQYVTVDCGSLTLKEFWGSALDYAPYTKVSIFLPFIGIRELNVDDCMNAVIHVKYNIDILTGDCVAGIKCGNGVIYKFTGNVKQTVPVSGRQSDMQMNMLKSVLSGAGGLVTGAAIGGAAGLVAAGASAASTVASSKFVTQRSGALDGSSGLLDDFVPYLIVHRPIQSLAKNYEKQKGYTSNISATLSSLKGYTEVEYIHLEGISGATDSELEEIESLLKKGVII